MNALLFVLLFTFLIHFAETTAYAMRLAGIRTRQIATSISFVNTAFLIARLSNMLQAPLLGAMVDIAARDSTGQATIQLGLDFRMIIMAGFAGTLTAALLIPTFAGLFSAGIRNFERNASIPKLILKALWPLNYWKVIKYLRLPSWRDIPRVFPLRIPKGFLIINVLVTAIYTIGVLASLYAGAMFPEYRATAVQLSGIVNGIATILFVLFVDPGGAHIVDQVVHGKKSEQDAQAMVFYLVVGRVLGVLLLAQLFFEPAARYILVVTKIISGVM